MLSQTGYGRGINSNQYGKATVEVKAVNGKFLDIVAKGRVSQIEELIKKEVQRATTRGSVEVRVFLDLVSSSASVNLNLAKSQLKLAKQLSKQTGAKQNVGAKELLATPGVVVDSDLEPEQLLSLVFPALQSALTAFAEFKKKEGQELAKDLKEQGRQIEQLLSMVEARVPVMLTENKEKMRARIKEILGDIVLDETKLANEIAYFIDRVDINEEIKRLKSHMLQYNGLLGQLICGKQLEFLSQEMTREINTMGSKSNDIEITNCVLAMKNVNEKIKEQIRNAE